MSVQVPKVRDCRGVAGDSEVEGVDLGVDGEGLGPAYRRAVYDVVR